MKTIAKLIFVTVAVLPLCAFAQNISAPLLTTFTNPTPVPDDWFGVSVAAMGSDRVLVGAYKDHPVSARIGAAYLFTTSGALLTTFTNPTPADSDWFGISVAAVGSDRVLIGAYGDDTGGAHGAGVAYLFNTNGTLLTTFTNPTPAGIADYFGFSVAALDGDRVLIGAYQADYPGGWYSGAAYLFDTNGTLLTTFTNPAPAGADQFGYSVAAVGSNRVLIGVPKDNVGADNIGSAYLFSANGTLLTTFTNPTPASGEFYGVSVAGVGNDRVLIGAYADSTGGTAVGAAYLFTTGGTLLTTFTNPTPANGDWFGCSVAAVGSDRVLIGAQFDDTGSPNAGAAYLFNTNGALLTTFINPRPAGYFGNAVTAVGSDRVLIGAYASDSSIGAAYLFAIPYPQLNIARSGTNILLSWIDGETGLILQETGLLGTPTVWDDTTELVSTDGLSNVVQQAIAEGITNRFYRLRRP